MKGLKRYESIYVKEGGMSGSLWGSVNKRPSIIDYPSGKFGFVGSNLPIDLVYQYINSPNKPISDEDADSLQRSSVLSFTLRGLGIESRRFDTKKDAELFLKKHFK